MKKLTSFAIAIFVLCSSVVAQSMFDDVNDFDGDGRADYAVTRNENGLKVWYLWRSTAGFGGVQWGVEGDTVTAGDYDGDNRTDIAVTRLSSAANGRLIFTTHYLTSASNSYGVIELNAANAVGSLAIYNEDYDGDGKADAGVFQWHAIGGLTFRKSSNGETAGVGMTWFQVKVGDLSGDGVAEVVSHNPGDGETTVKNIITGTSHLVRFGGHGDRWVAADFDGDNKGEIAIFRPSTGVWWWIRSSDSIVNAVHFGQNGDLPVPADYDDDGITDHAVYRPGSPSTYWALKSTGGSSVFGFGLSTDVPVTY